VYPEYSFNFEVEHQRTGSFIALDVKKGRLLICMCVLYILVFWKEGIVSILGLKNC
jgi:hypothetical protein